MFSNFLNGRIRVVKDMSLLHKWLFFEILKVLLCSLKPEILNALMYVACYFFLWKLIKSFSYFKVSQWLDLSGVIFIFLLGHFIGSL